jgi:hypothetical protein
VPLKNVTDSEIRGLIVNARQDVRTQKGQIGAGRLAQKGEGTAALNERILYKNKAKQDLNEITGTIDNLPPFASNIKDGALDAMSKLPDSLRSVGLSYDAPD